MQKHSSFIDKHQLHQSFFQVIEIMKEKQDKFGDICYIYDKEGLKLSETDTFQFFLTSLTPNNSIERMFYEMLIRLMYQMEVKSGGSSYFVYTYALELFQMLLKNEALSKSQESLLQQELEQSFEQFFKPLFISCSSVANEQLLHEAIQSNTSDNKNLGIAIYEALMLAGLEGRIFVENGKQPNYIVELKNGYTFKSVEPFKFLLDSETSWKRNNVRVMIIDGVIEEVSELDKLLNKASETQQPLLIIAMGYGEEIAATCKANNDKGIFDIQLLKFTNDVWSLNVANDIAIVCGTTPISSLQGHLTAFVNWEELPTVDKVHVGLKETTIENRNSQTSVLVHMKTILDKKNNANVFVEDIQNIYDARLKSLASNAVYLYLPLVTEVENKSLRIAIDNILRNTKALLNYGVLNEEKLRETLSANSNNSELTKVMCKALQNTNSLKRKNQVPLLTVALGTYLVTKMCLMLVSSNGYIALF